jgi:hypothetical protein
VPFFKIKNQKSIEMKKLLSLCFLLAFTLSALAQSTSPRFGTAKNQDNTGRVLTYKLITTNDDAGNDTITVNANAWQTIVRPSSNITDSVNIKASLTNCYLGDELYVIVSKGTGAGAIRFPSASFTNDAAANRYTIAANKTAVFYFKFNGSKWHMVSKTIQP